MEQIIKSYLGLFFLVVMMATGFGLISSAIIARGANNLACQYALDIECSNIATSVVDDCISRVRSNSRDAYDDLIVTFNEDDLGKRRGKMVLTYHYNIPFIGIETNKSIVRQLN